jgi:hypothetical protein
MKSKPSKGPVILTFSGLHDVISKKDKTLYNHHCENLKFYFETHPLATVTLNILICRVFADDAYSRKPQIVNEMNGYITNVQNMMGGEFVEMLQTLECVNNNRFSFSAYDIIISKIPCHV